MLLTNHVIHFRPILIDDKMETPTFDIQSSLKLLKKKSEKKVSFARAYRGWRISGSREEIKLGSGGSFLKWLAHHQLSILWAEDDFYINPLFSGPSSPKHSVDDEYAKDHSFALRPVMVRNRSIKLYISDQHMFRLLNYHHGESADFLDLIKLYITFRFDWEKWEVPIPLFLDWMISHQKRPVFQKGQVGLFLRL